MAPDAKKYACWQQHFNRWQESALTQRAYGAREGLALSTFDRWPECRDDRRRPQTTESVVACDAGLRRLSCDL
ncbi:MAG: IS66 family insertion sequence element accessory protein TnpA [Acidiferrobacterales bacterium]